MKRVSTLVVKAETVDRIDGKELQLTAVDKIRQRSDHGLALELPFITGTGGKTDKGRSPVSVDNNAQLESQAMGIPAMEFTFHQERPLSTVHSKFGEARVCQWSR